ncbi:MAG: phosphoadenylyl-sulfate reductase [Pseudomonadota bacterium]
MTTAFALAPAPAIVRRLSDDASAELLERVLGDEPADALLERVLREGLVGEVAVVSSFGAESAILLHLVASIDRRTPVLFIDTGKLFPETLAYRDALTTLLGLEDVRTVGPDPSVLRRSDPTGERHRLDHDGCCELRKTVPLEHALTGFDAWLSGRKRHQSDVRVTLPRFETDARGRIKVNPLADWTPEEQHRYVERYRLPTHPLVPEGYASIGCAPCTSRIAPGEHPRAGRWRGADKTECGIHVVDGKLVRSTPDG